MPIKELTEDTLLWWVQEFKGNVIEYILNILELLGCDEEEILSSASNTIISRFTQGRSLDSFKSSTIEELVKDDSFVFDVTLYAMMCIKVDFMISPSEYIDVVNVISEIPVSDKGYGVMVPIVRLIKRFNVPINLIPKRILNMCYQGGEYIKANLVMNSIMEECIKECHECIKNSADFENLLSLLDTPIATLVKVLHNSDCYDHKDALCMKTILIAHTFGIQGYIPGIYNYPDVLERNDSDIKRLEIMAQIVRAAYEITKGDM